MTICFRLTPIVLLTCCVAQEKAPIGRLEPEMAVARTAVAETAADKKVADEAAVDGLDWHDVSTWGVEGRILPSAKRLRWFDRLPADAESLRGGQGGPFREAG